MLNTDQHRQAPITIFLSAAILLLAALPLAAQDAPAAPLPAQLATAKSVFLSNAGPEDNTISARAYTTLYKGLRQWNHYSLVAAPANAELVLELRYTDPLTNINVMNGGSFPPDHRPRFQLIIRDRATGIILWSVTESPSRMRNRNDNAVNALLADLKVLAAGQYPPASLTKTKTRLSDKK